MVLYLRNSKNGSMVKQMLARGISKYGPKIARTIYNRFKSYRSRRNYSVKSPQAALVPTTVGRNLISIPRNLPKKMRQGQKHCNALVRKSLVIFKDSVMKRANRIYRFIGVYKGYGNGFDSSEYNPGDQTSRINTAFKGQGGQIGFGMNAIDTSSSTVYEKNFAYRPGNCFVFALEMAGCQTLPHRFTQNDCVDFYDAVGPLKQNRQFAFLLDFTAYYGIRKTFCFNDVEDQTLGGIAALAGSYVTYTSTNTIPRLYTLSYKYTLEFQNTSYTKMKVCVFFIKFKSAVITDFSAATNGTFGLSNIINRMIKPTTYDSMGTYLIEHDQMPGNMFTVIKKRTFVLGGLTSGYANDRLTGNPDFRKTIYIKSKRGFLYSCSQPSNGASTLKAGSPTSEWYNDKAEKMTYVYMHAYPVDVKPAVPETVGAPGFDKVVLSNSVMFKITKENNYCLIDQ